MLAAEWGVYCYDWLALSLVVWSKSDTLSIEYEFVHVIKQKVKISFRHVLQMNAHFRCVAIKATGNSRSGIPGNSREIDDPKIPAGIPGNFMNCHLQFFLYKNSAVSTLQLYYL